jgi:hypothetical protein
MVMNTSWLSKENAMNIPFCGNFEINSRKADATHRVTDAEMKNIPSDDENNTILRQIILKLFHEKTSGSYVKLEAMTQIKQDTFRRWMKGARNPSKKELAKFVVGLGIEIEITEKLFCLNGHPLNCKENRLDFIVACAIKDKDDIEQFGNDVKKYCDGLSIF